MLTPLGMENLLKDMIQTGGLTEHMEESIRKLKDEFDEREGILAKYGEAYDGTQETYDWKPKDDTDWKGKFEQLEARYRERFFSGGYTRGINHNDTTILNETEVDTKEATLSDILYE